MAGAAAGDSDRPLEQLSGFERVRLTWRLFHDDRVPVWMKALVPIIAVIYLIVPIDLVPDFLIGLGQIDDLGVIGIAVFAMSKILPRLAPSTVSAEHLAEMRGGRRPHARRTDEHMIDAAYQIVEDDAKAAPASRIDQHWEKSA